MKSLNDYYLSTIRSLFLFTGLEDALFCNAFIKEAIQLILNSLVLYEDGFFDCAFYSLRQSVEIMNSMLICSTDETKYQSWQEKARFPFDGKIKTLLDQSCSNYSEIKNALPEFFNRFEELLKQANKIIHKQGFDTFYTFISIHENPDKKTKDRENLFVLFLDYCIGMVIFLYIALDPISLIVTDEDVLYHIPFDYMTEPVPISFFDDVFSPSSDYIERIRQTQFYCNLKEYFLSLEELKPATFSLIHYQYFDIDNLSDIRSQLHLVSPLELRILTILEKGIKASHFYSNECLLGYYTSIKSNAVSNGFSSDQFNVFLNKPFETNIAWRGVYISLFHVSDGYLIIEHNEALTDDEKDLINKCLNNGFPIPF